MKKALSFLIIIATALSLTACGGGKSFSLTYTIESAPKNIDPILASSESEITVSGNIFEGLMRMGKDGKPVKAGAESYTVSDDGCEYTFRISKNACWQNGEAVTAADYVFAARRAADPATKAAFPQLISDIRGAADALAGLTSPDSIGVYAADERTVKYVLVSPSDRFLSMLTQPVFMPCNEEFFNRCKGKYGLNYESVLSNGPFSLSAWDSEKGELKLIRSSKYSGNFEPQAYEVTFEKETEKPKGYVANAISSGGGTFVKISLDDIESVSKNNEGVYNTFSSLYAIIINPNSKIAPFAPAFKISIDPDKLAAALPEYLKAARGAVPPDCDVSLTASNAAPEPTYDPGTARETFLNCQNNMQSEFPKDISVLCTGEKTINPALKSVVSDWQKNLGAYINIETEKDETQFENRIASGDYDIALVRFTSGDLSAASFLSRFKSDSTSDPSGFKNAAFDNALESACKAGSSQEQMHTAEQILLTSDDRLIPLFFSPTSYAYSAKIDKNSINFRAGFLDIATLKE